MSHWLSTFLAHPLHGDGYQWWSGIGSVFTPKDIVVVGLAYAFMRKHNCHITGCWRLQFHPHPDHGHPVCKKHHPNGKGLKHNAAD